MDNNLVKLLAAVFDIKPTEIHENLKKQDIARWDSLTHMDLITAIEREYHIELSMEEITEMTTISNIISILEKRELVSNV